MFKKLISKITDFEKRLFFLLPAAILSVIVVDVIESNINAIIPSLIFYVYLGILGIISYFLMKKLSYMLGRFYLTLTVKPTIEGFPKKMLLLRYRIMSYSAAFAAAYIYLGGINHDLQIMFIFSWGLLGVMVASRRLVQEIKEMD